MAIDIFGLEVKTKVNTSIEGKTILAIAKSKAGKSTFFSKSPRPLYIATEPGQDSLTGITIAPCGNWTTFTAIINQLASPKGREMYDSIIIDSLTNLVLFLDKYVGSKLSTDKNTLDYGSHADYGKGTTVMKNDLTFQLTKLKDLGYFIGGIVHAEDKTDFNTQKEYIGTSLTTGLFGVAEKFFDNIIYLEAVRVNAKGTNTEGINYLAHLTDKNIKKPTSFVIGGRYKPAPGNDVVESDFNTVIEALLGNVDPTIGTKEKVISQSFTQDFDFTALQNEFRELTNSILESVNPVLDANGIKNIVEEILGAGKKVGALKAPQAELLKQIIDKIKEKVEEKENN